MNKPNFKILFLSFLLCTISAVTIYSQSEEVPLSLNDTTQIHLLIFKKGKKIKGRIISIQNDEVVFLKTYAKENSVFSLSEIKDIKVQGKESTWFDSPAHQNDYAQYLLFTNTAFGLKKNARNYRTFMGTSMLFDYGIDNGVSLGIAYSFPLMISVNTKFTFNIKQDAHAAGLKFNYMTLPILLGSEEGFSILESTIMNTFGSTNKFFNISFSNYWIRRESSVGFITSFFPTVYNSLSIGGGFHLKDNFHLQLENRINFNSQFIDAKFLPSIALSYNTQGHHISVGFLSPNQLGFNSIPIIDFTEDDISVFTASFISRLPFLTYSKLF